MYTNVINYNLDHTFIFVMLAKIQRFDYSTPSKIGQAPVLLLRGIRYANAFPIYLYKLEKKCFHFC